MKLYCFGDAGNYSTDLINILKKINKKKNILYILLGDNFYPLGINNKNALNNIEQKFKKIFNNNTIYALLGNHDYSGDPSLQINAPFWNMPNYFYFKNINNIGCWFINTQIFDPGNSDDENMFLNLYSKINEVHENYLEIFNIQLKWLENSLEENKKLENKLIFGHYPIIIAGIYEKNDKLYSVLIKYFYKYNINAYISGHDHNLQHLQMKIGNNYTFNQFISGCNDSEHAYNYFNKNDNSLFFDIEPGILQISVNKKNKLKFIFKNKLNKNIYTYTYSKIN